MGIINLTPDSFHDGGQHNEVEHAFARATELIDEGADILDLGAYSTRPGAKNVSAGEEWRRLKEPIEAIRNAHPNVLISIDTFRSEIAEKAITAGSDIINDISGGNFDKHMFATVAALQVPYIMMHIQGTPETMQQNPSYKNVVADLLTYFSKKINQLREHGVNDIILDPGFGFGKTLQHNFQLLNQLQDFSLLELPILVGVSRKSMINKALSIKPADALNGTTALHAFALDRGANILRVHDVKEAKQVVTLHQHLQR